MLLLDKVDVIITLLLTQIFGPLLPVMTVKNADEAIDFINARYALEWRNA